MKLIEEQPKIVEFIMTPKEYSLYESFEALEQNAQRYLEEIKCFNDIFSVMFVSHSPSEKEVITEFEITYK